MLLISFRLSSTRKTSNTFHHFSRWCQTSGMSTMTRICGRIRDVSTRNDIWTKMGGLWNRTKWFHFPLVQGVAWEKILPGLIFFSSSTAFCKFQGSSQQRPVWTVHGRNPWTCVFGISLSDDIWREITVYIHWQDLEAHCTISVYIFIAFDRVAVCSSRDELRKNLKFYKWTTQTSCGFRGWIRFFLNCRSFF